MMLGCQAAEPVVPTPTLTPTPLPSPTLAPSPTATATPLPTLTPIPTPPPTFTPFPSPTPTLTPSPTETPTPRPTSSVDRTCPEFFFPEYKRYWLAADAWPTPVPNPQPHFRFAKPLEPGVGRLLTQPFYPYGYDGGTQYGLLLHNGVDVAEDLGDPILAVADGVVVTARDDMEERFGWRCNWYGQLVVIEHNETFYDQPVYTLYGHVLNISVEEGERVEQGQQIAEIGFGGAAKAWHLHFEVRVGENDFTNPFLDDAADLVACPEDMENLGVFVIDTGAMEVARAQGFVLYSVPVR